MHILVATLPLVGHLLPMEVVVRTLVRRGHTVTWLTGARGQGVATRAGAVHRPLSSDGPWVSAPLANCIASYEACDESQVQDCHGLGVDAVLADPTMLGVHHWAGETSTPLDIFGMLPLISVSEHARRVYQTTVSDFEPWIIWEGEPVEFVGPLVVRTQWQAPAWWPAIQKARERVVIYQSSMHGDPQELAIPALEALQGTRVTPIVNRELPGVLYGHPWLPATIVLPGAKLLITSGGYGSIQAALTYGVPVVVAGDTEDKGENGRRVEYAGVGVSVGRPFTSEKLQAAVAIVLTTPRFAERAQELARRLPARAAEQTIVDGLMRQGRRAA
jgi:UDP:flavonoid glycosyltransferase YjiC (YdhE family)